MKFIEGNTQEVDMWLMSNAKYHIIANSSFSWWGAWLKNYDLGITIAPTPWFEREELIVLIHAQRNGFELKNKSRANV